MSSIATLGDSIEDYEVFEFLGKGGFAEVYRARSRLCGLQVAIKMVDRAQERTCPDLKRRVQQEVKIHCRLKHPSVLELYNYFENKRYVYLVLEYCASGTLQGYLDARGGTLSEPEARHLLQQIVEGLLYLHSHAIMHRDLSPANLLLTKDLHVKIGDFGLATRLSHPAERHTTLCGTPNYISPEVASRGSHGLEADVWSIGVLFHLLLVGKPPGVSGTLSCSKRLSHDASSLLAGLLQRDPRHRLPLSEVLRQPFFLRGSAKALRPLSLAVAPQKPFNTCRLRPVRLRARHTILSIQPSGQACIEFIRNGVVAEVCIVSGDGRQVASFRPRGPGQPPGDAPPPLPPDVKWLQWNGLNERLQGRYASLSRFVGLVRQKTPKVVLYTPQAACMLTENRDFEASFYAGGKVVQTAEEVRVTDVLGQTTTYSASDSPSGEHWDLFCESKRYCQALEAAIESAAAPGFDPFPAVFGRKPREAQSGTSPSSRMYSRRQDMPGFHSIFKDASSAKNTPSITYASCIARSVQ
ncbi:serine/threonine-protein kinase PLK4-like [Ornithodoros turicata]|uniref:serine/threonine-protein kinase PLK4-like n=1 Tax=Ornithodoros turicata TaxID=34597 RepID=UPI0031389095